MYAQSTPEVVNFITTEEGDDLIVSFAIAAQNEHGVVSLTLLRTPKFEFALPADEWGVTVSHESFPDEHGPDLLHRIRVVPPKVLVESARTWYELDVSKVDHRELRSALRVLELMNFDHRFAIELTERLGRTPYPY